MATRTANGMPDRYRPVPPRASPLNRITWLFTPAGRARLQLARAHRTPGDPSRFGRLVRINAALHQTRKFRQESNRLLVREILLFLTWCCLRKGADSEAGRWLSELDRDFPALTARLSLRWQLMEQLLRSRALDPYAEQARKFFADPLLRYEDYPGAVLETMRAAYSEISPAACKSVVSGAHPKLAATKSLQAALALCSCPEDFSSAEEAKANADRMSPEQLSFCTRMHTDALLVLARSAEWAGDWKSMTERSQDALKLLPDYPEARYWHARAILHTPETSTSGIRDEVPDTPSWNRLIRQIHLHREPTLSRANEALPVLSGDYGELGKPEKELTVDLLRRALTLDAARIRENAAVCARLSRSIESAVGKLPWTQVNIALEEILVRNLYAAAAQRLEKKCMRGDPTAQTLARAARILAGNPAQASPAGAYEPFGPVETAMFRILRDVRSSRPEDYLELRRRIGLARQEPIFRWIPQLTIVAEVVSLALGILAGDGETGEQISQLDLPDGSPEWVTWLYVRIALAACDCSRAGPVLAKCAPDSPAIAWFAGGWWANHGRASIKPPRQLEQAKATVAGLVSQLPKQLKSFMGAIAAARASGYRKVASGQERTRAAIAFPSLGDLAKALCGAEVNLEADYAVGRSHLAAGDAGAALGLFKKLGEALAEMSALSGLAWGPVIDYWIAVAAAQTGSDKASFMLRKLVGSPKGAEAKAQLALMAIRDRNLEEATQWLCGVPEDLPAALYARALLYERRGEPEAARDLLVSRKAWTVLQGSPYLLAAQRLLAGICERQGSWDDAEQIHREILEASPADRITKARLGRLITRRGYPPSDCHPSDENSTTPELLQAGAEAAGWCGDYLLLHQIVASNDWEPDALIVKVTRRAESGAAASWRQAAARALLRTGRAQDARRLVCDPVCADVPRWLSRSRLILTAWHILSHAWQLSPDPDTPSVQKRAARLWEEAGQPQGRDSEFWLAAERMLQTESLHGCVSPDLLSETRHCLQEMKILLAEGHDLGLARWRRLLEEAHAVASGGTNGMDTSAADSLAIDTWPAGQVLWLWNEMGERRRRVADSLISLVSHAQLGWDPVQRDLIAAVAAWQSGQDDLYLEHYQRLLPYLESMPVYPQELWLAAAQIWFRQRDWRRLLEGDLPQCVEDLSHPEARLLMGLGYAHAAIETDDPYRAAASIRQAKEMLSPLTRESEQ